MAERLRGQRVLQARGLKPAASETRAPRHAGLASFARQHAGASCCSQTAASACESVPPPPRCSGRAAALLRCCRSTYGPSLGALGQVYQSSDRATAASLIEQVAHAAAWLAASRCVLRCWRSVRHLLWQWVEWTLGRSIPARPHSLQSSPLVRRACATARASSGSSTWVEAGGVDLTGRVPWCPGQPNNAGGSEDCAILASECSTSNSTVRALVLPRAAAAWRHRI